MEQNKKVKIATNTILPILQTTMAIGTSAVAGDVLTNYKKQNNG